MAPRWPPGARHRRPGAPRGPPPPAAVRSTVPAVSARGVGHRFAGAAGAFVDTARSPDLRRAPARLCRGLDRRVGLHGVPLGLRLPAGRRHGGGGGRAGPDAALGGGGPAPHAVRRPLAARSGPGGRVRRAWRRDRAGFAAGGPRRGSRLGVRPGRRVDGGRDPVPAGPLGAAALAVPQPAGARRSQRGARAARLARHPGRPAAGRRAAGGGRRRHGVRGRGPGIRLVGRPHAAGARPGAAGRDPLPGPESVPRSPKGCAPSAPTRGCGGSWD